MYPFGGIIVDLSEAGLRDTLWLPGIDSVYTLPTAVSTYPANATCGFKFLNTGNFQTFRNAIYTSVADAWIDDSSVGIVDASLYEFMVTNLAGDTGFMGSSTVDAWISAEYTSEYYVRSIPTSSGSAVVHTVTGTWAIREKANHVNTISGSFSMTSQGESLS